MIEQSDDEVECETIDIYELFIFFFNIYLFVVLTLFDVRPNNYSFFIMYIIKYRVVRIKWNVHQENFQYINVSILLI